MSGIISSATEFFNNTLHSNQYEIKDASKEKIKDIYNKSVDYATANNRDVIIAKIDLFIQKITLNLWTASIKNVSLISRINELKLWVDKCIDDCSQEQLGDRDYIALYVDRAIFHYAISFVCNKVEHQTVSLIDRCTFDVASPNGLPSTIQLFYEKSIDDESIASLHLQTLGDGFINLENAYHQYDDIRLKPLASLLISCSYGSALADSVAAVDIDEYCEKYITDQVKTLSQQEMKKNLKEMKNLAVAGKLDFNDIVTDMKRQEDEGKRVLKDVTKMHGAAQKLNDFVQSCDPDSTELIQIPNDISNSIYDLFGIELVK